MFYIEGQGHAVRWSKVVDDIVAVNVACCPDGPDAGFHVTAHNKHAEKILDSLISYPGDVDEWKNEWMSELMNEWVNDAADAVFHAILNLVV